MDLKQAIIFVLLISSLILCFFFPTFASSLVFLSASSLFCFTEFINNKKVSDLSEIKEQIKDLNERIDQMSFSRLGNR